MPTEDSRFDGAMDAAIRRCSGRTITIVCAALWPGLGLLLPLALRWSWVVFIELNVVGTLLAFMLAIAWLLEQVQRGHRRRLLQWTSNLRLLDAQEFEWLVGELFRREGWSVEETGKPDAADGNVDLRLTRGKERRIVQCKRWQSWPVGVDDIRAFAGTVAIQSAGAGIFVALSTFTTDAEREARQANIELIDGTALDVVPTEVVDTRESPHSGFGTA